jgi:hypothetical protein
MRSVQDARRDRDVGSLAEEVGEGAQVLGAHTGRDGLGHRGADRGRQFYAGCNLVRKAV